MSLSNFIKNILNIQDNNISFPEEDYCQIIKKDDYLIKIFKASLKSNYCSCPHYNSKNIVKNGSRVRKIKFIPFQNYSIQLNLGIQRYICKDCKKTFSPSTNIVEDYSNISNNLKHAIALGLQENVSLTFIAKRYNISIATVQRVMNDCYSDFKVNREYLPETICIDEFKSVKNIDGAMSFVFADYQTKNIIDIVEDRKLNSLIEYFSRFSLEARNDVNFNIYQDIIQSIRHNNFKRFEDIVKKNCMEKDKVSKKMLVALKTLKKYMEYIKNMFETNITNGLIEGLNNEIKSIKRTAFGYSNFSNFRKRVLIQAGIIPISA